MSQGKVKFFAGKEFWKSQENERFDLILPEGGRFSTSFIQKKHSNVRQLLVGKCML